MVTVIKKGLDIKKLAKLLDKAMKFEGVDTHKFCGQIKVKEDPLTIQKRMRNEWE